MARGAEDEVTLLRPSRRGFIAGSGGLALGVLLRLPIARAESGSGRLDVDGGDATPSLFVAIDADGSVRITCHRSEMGQGTWTAMAQIVADELEARG